LIQAAAPAMKQMAEAAERAGCKLAGIYRFLYRAGSWRKQRLIVSRLEHDERGANPRFI